MTAIEKILLRKDMAAVAVAVVIGFAVTQMLSMIVMPLANTIVTDAPYAVPGNSAKDQYLYPVVTFVLTLIAFELLLRIVIFARQLAYKKGKK